MYEVITDLHVYIHVCLEYFQRKIVFQLIVINTEILEGSAHAEPMCVARTVHHAHVNIHSFINGALIGMGGSGHCNSSQYDHDNLLAINIKTLWSRTVAAAAATCLSP